MTRQHPIAILKYVSKNFWLLLIPFVRGISYMKHNFYGWAEGAYVDIIVLVFLFGTAVLKWSNVKYSITENNIKLKKGFFVVEEICIPFDSITAIFTGEYLLIRIFKAVYLSIDSDAFSDKIRHSDADINIIISLIEYQKLYKLIPDIQHSENKKSVLSNKKTLLFSLVFSSFLSGALYFITFFIQSGKLVYNEIEKRFVSAVNEITEIAEKIIYGITPFTISVAVVIAVGWLISFTLNYLRYINFSVARYNDLLFIGNGFFTERKYFIRTENINFIDLKQNLLMKLCRVITVNIDCPGYSERVNKIPVFIPISKKTNTSETIKKIIPEFIIGKAEMCPRVNSFVRYIIFPLMQIYGIIALSFFLVMIFPDWYKVIFYCSVMGEVLSLYFLALKITDYFTSGMGCDEKLLTMKYRKIFHFHYIMIPYDKIVKIAIRQSVFQKRRSSCDFIVYTKNKKFQRYIVNEINIDDAVKIVKCLDYSFCNI